MSWSARRASSLVPRRAVPVVAPPALGAALEELGVTASLSLVVDVSHGVPSASWSARV